MGSLHSAQVPTAQGAQGSPQARTLVKLPACRAVGGGDGQLVGMLLQDGCFVPLK